MSTSLPPALENLIEAFKILPGVGTRSAERYAYNILKRDPKAARQLSESLTKLHGNISICKVTYALIPSGQEYSDLYTDPTRNKRLVLVVAEPLDILAIEKTGLFHGTYHVLGGLVSPIDNVSPDQLKIKELTS